MAEEIKVGMIGLDTSHTVAFTKMLNDPESPHFIPDARVVVACPTFSEDVQSSVSRVEGYTQDLRDNFGVKMVETVEEVCEESDAILLESVDGRRHLPEYRPVAEAGLPCFIDKPFTASLEDAKEIVRIAKEKKTRLFSSSSLRMIPDVRSIKDSPERVGEIERVHVFSPASHEPTNPGLYWYGIHGVEILYTLMGAGCESLLAVSDEKADTVVARWKDGRTSTYTGTRLTRHDYGFVVHGTKETVATVCNLSDIYVPLVKSIIEFFKGAKPPVPLETTLEMMAFIDAALKSKGDWVALPDLS
ncbi:MAG: Gfo/Idh/MocA family oxidoreductase [Candidatus Omnitrophica bacterium]|nr:Gfo/Idh/MocA family oxidoreductase [Candidatus Omnitrophota bacterium]